MADGIGLVTKTYLDRELIEPLTSGTMTVGGSHTIYAGSTLSSDTAGYWHANIDGITELYDGLTVKVRLMTSYNSTANSLNVNGLGDKLVCYRYNSILTSHVPSRSEILLTYREQAHTGYTPTSTFNAFVKNTTYTDGWVLNTQYQDGNNYERYLPNYERFYAKDRLTRYQICGLDVDGRVVPLTPLASGSYDTGTTKTCTTVPLNPYKFYYYTTTSVVSAGAIIGANTLYEAMPITSVRYTFNSDLSTYKNIYLCGTMNANGLFVLKNNSTTSWYVQVPKNTGSLNLSDYFTAGYYYIRLGATYSSANYFQLAPTHELYYYDGTSLLPYTSKAEDATKVNGYNVQVVTSMPASPDANTIYILKN